MTTLQVHQHSRVLLLTLALWLMPALFAQGGRGGGGAAPPATAKAAAPTDFVGQWVNVVTEDWRYRMITPKKGDYAGVPLSADGRKLADSWDPAKDEAAGEQCRTYGAAAVLRAPGRIRISWADDDTLKVEADAGTQTRMFYFKDPKAQGGDWQGVSQASWETGGTQGGTGGQNFGGGGGAGVVGAGGVAGDAAAAAGDAGAGGGGGGGRGGRGRGPMFSGALKIVTTKMKPGYLRKNGVPYSDKAVVTEYFDRTNEPNGETWLVVKTIVDDPLYLSQQFIISSHFKKENDQSKWNPTPCSSR